MSLLGAGDVQGRRLGRGTGRQTLGFLSLGSQAPLLLARPVRDSRAQRSGPSAYVTGGHAGAPAPGKQGGGGSQGGRRWGVWGQPRSPIVCGCEGVTGPGGS